MLVYDVNDKKTFDELTPWIEELWRYSDRGVIPLVILALGDRGQQSLGKEVGEAYASALSKQVKQSEFVIKHFDSKVNTGQNIDEAFVYLGQQIIMGIETGKIILRRLAP